MARLLQQYIEPVEPCSYLSDRQARLDTRLMLDVTPVELESLLERGWRRFGPSYFRPACEPCRECMPIRIPVASFRASKSQRRAWRNCAGLRVVASPPRVDRARLELYHSWHATREEARGWSASPLTEKIYALQFAFPHPCAVELAYYEALGEGRERLVGVALCDQTPSAFSAAYFFYHPDWAHRSLGVYNVLYQVEYARARGLAHLYLGFRIAPCPSMRYKARFRPHELLQGRPRADEVPRWLLAADTDTDTGEPADSLERARG